jgi:two-component system nitrogen regulation sensor histidine kinase NtrY
MVDEFSAFAKTPKPVVETHNLADIARQVVFLMRVGYPDIEFEVEVPPEPMMTRFDRRLISQALTNIVKNAVEAIEAVPAEGRGKGHILMRAGREGTLAVIDVIDNGIGLPQDNRDRLLEPYVTTREKGTGLGLAIVGKILEEHGGEIDLRDAPEAPGGRRGAWVRLTFAAEGIASAPPSESETQSTSKETSRV